MSPEPRAPAVYNPRIMRMLPTLTTLILAAAALAAQQRPATLPTETPSEFKPVTDSFDYTRREVMIPMRDGIKLHTVILVPKGAARAPILLTRTPYDATGLTTHANSTHLASALYGYDNATDVIVEGGYIRVVQDVRGKYGSEGGYVMNRPLAGPLNPTQVDHATDTYDTIDWLVKNIPETNGKVGILGISYDGFLPLMALVNPHPALKVSVPMNPMVDGWMGDDWFHNGAFRQQMMPYIHDQEATRAGDISWWSGYYDDYDAYMQAGSAGELARQHGLDQVGFWRKISQHPAYDSWWQQQAMDKVLGALPLKVPVMLVHSLWDQEDIYGAPAVYRAIEPKDTGNDKVFLVMGPWHHGQEIREGSSLGAIRFNSDTALYLPPGDPAAVPRSLPQGRRAEDGRGAGHGVRNRHEHLAQAERVAVGMRERLHDPADAHVSRFEPVVDLGASGRNRVRRVPYPIRQSRCPSARGRFSLSAGRSGPSGSWTISAKPRAVPTSWRSCPTC